MLSRWLPNTALRDAIRWIAPQGEGPAVLQRNDALGVLTKKVLILRSGR